MNKTEIDTKLLIEIIDAWGRGFNPYPDALGPIARDLLRARGFDHLNCSLCGDNTLTESHKCDRSKWK